MNFYNDAISAVYHHGSKIVLNTEWRDKNVICPNSKFYFVISGEICVETENQTLIAKEGDAILIPAGTKHSYHLTELGFAEKYWFHFDLRIGQTNFFDYTDMQLIKHIGNSKQIRGLCEEIVNEQVSTPSQKLYKSSAILSLIGIYMESLNYVNVTPTEKDETDKVITFVKKNYSEKFTLNELSHIANLAPNYFAKKFKEKTGYPPLKYVNILRVERAKFLLEHTNIPINKIMEDVGFYDFAHFTKLFKKETGYSPTKFRSALKRRYVLNK